MDFFADTRPELDDALPHWWKHRDPSSELWKVLEALGQLADELAEDMEGVYGDLSLASARDDALREEWAVIWGLGSEQAPGMTTEALRATLQALAAYDGSAQSLESVLIAFTHGGLNDAAPSTTLDATFPADGSGLPLWQATPDRGYLFFAADGSGLGLDATFPTANGRVEVIERFTDSRIDVNVRNFLIFDRNVFARLVDRLRPAHLNPSVITETSS